ncbi:diguanylate cyclase domain-containing protein [Lysobacter terrae]
MDDPEATSDDDLRAQLARAEAVLQTQQARLEQVLAALRALPDGIVLLDRAGRITDLNLGAVHLTGWTEAQALGRSLHEVVKLRDSQGRSVDLLALGHDASGQVASLVRRDEHEVLVDATIASILDRAEQPIGAVIAFRNVTAAKRIKDELTFHATHDPLTGVINRRAFESQLQRAVAHASRHGTPYALLYLDLDRFKAVNDTAGHIAGDELLRVLSALLQRSLRDHDTLARLGGDEFAVLLEHCEAGEAEEIAERIRAAVATFRFRWLAQEFSVGASIGLVTFRSGALTPQAVLRRADEMCYRAKAEGRNQIQVFPMTAADETRQPTRPPRRKRTPPPLQH